MLAIPARTLVAAAVLSLGIASTVHADETRTEVPYAAGKAKVEQAKAAHARVTTVLVVKKVQLQRLPEAEARLVERTAAPPV